MAILSASNRMGLSAIASHAHRRRFHGHRRDAAARLVSLSPGFLMDSRGWTPVFYAFSAYRDNADDYLENHSYGANA
ncbi:hypothetical protein M8494_13465 [Serratia ureilytica]